MSRTLVAVAVVLLGAALTASGATTFLPLVLARTLAVAIVALLATAAALEALRLGRPLRTTHGVAPPRRSRIALLTVLLFGLGLMASGALRVGDGGASAGIRLTSAYGPLTVWPTLQAASPHHGLGLHLTLGHGILIAVSAFVMATTVQVLTAAVACRAGALRPLAGLSPLALLPSACPFCLPVWASLGGAAAAPLAASASDPLSPLGAFLGLSAPLFALGALHLARRRHDAGASPWDSRALRRVAVTSVFLLSLLAVPAVAALAGMPRGDSARQDAIYGLMVLTTIVAVFLVLLVFILMIVFAYRYREHDDAAPRDDWVHPQGRRKVLIASFFIVPMVFIFGLGAVSFTVLMDHEDEPEGATHIDVIATQFAWRFTYPDGEVRLHELHVIEDVPVSLNLTSPDVVHSLFIPDLGVKMDAMPGTTTQTWFEARNTGTYAAYCVEWCGHGHPEMRATVIVHPAGTPLPPDPKPEQ